MDAQPFAPYVHGLMRLLILLSALLSAIAGYSPAASAGPVIAGQVEQVVGAVPASVSQRQVVMLATCPDKSPAVLAPADMVATRAPIYDDRLLI